MNFIAKSTVPVTRHLLHQHHSYFYLIRVFKKNRSGCYLRVAWDQGLWRQMAITIKLKHRTTYTFCLFIFWAIFRKKPWQGFWRETAITKKLNYCKTWMFLWVWEGCKNVLYVYVSVQQVEWRKSFFLSSHFNYLVYKSAVKMYQNIARGTTYTGIR